MKTKKLSLKLNYLFLLGVVLLTNSSEVFAEGTTYVGFDKLFEMFAGIIQKVAGGVGFLGAVFFGMSIYQDNPDGKVKGIKMMASGGFLFAVSTGYKMFLL